jgi:hypothetical protein
MLLLGMSRKRHIGLGRLLDHAGIQKLKIFRQSLATVKEAIRSV